MAIFRVHKDNNFTIISNNLIRDNRLSLKARGLMILMLSLPDDWNFSIEGLAAINKESSKTIKTMLAELKEFGYLVVTKLMPNETESKKIEYIYDLFEIPGEKQGTQNQPLDNQPIENCRQLNKEEQRKEEQSTSKEKIIKKKFDAIAFLDTIPVITKDPELKDAFVSFIELRKSMHKPIATEDALKRIIKKAWELGNGNRRDIIAVLNQSIVGGYQGLFELKNNNNQIAPRTTVKASGSSGTNESALDFFNRIEAEEMAKEAAT